MDFILMILIADVVSFCMLVGSICFSILILDKLGVFENKGDENDGIVD